VVFLKRAVLVYQLFKVMSFRLPAPLSPLINSVPRKTIVNQSINLVISGSKAHRKT